MPWSLFDILLLLPTYALVLFRISGLMLTAPVLSSSIVPLRMRAGLTAVIAAMVVPLVAKSSPTDLTLVSVMVGGVGELVIGASVGLALSLVLMGAELGGLLVGQQAGLSIASVFDPSRNQQVTIMGQLYTNVLVLFFLIAGGHRAAIAAVLDTYEIMPMLTVGMHESIVVLLVELMTAAFVLGIRLAVPGLLALFLTSTAMAFLSKTMPQMNILSVGFIVRVVVALGVTIFALSASQELLLDALRDSLETVRESFKLGPAGSYWMN